MPLPSSLSRTHGAVIALGVFLAHACSRTSELAEVVSLWLPCSADAVEDCSLVPGDCEAGDETCELSWPLVMGTSSPIDFSGPDGTDFQELEIDSSDESVMRVEKGAPVEGMPTWIVHAESPGSAVLGVTDAGGEDVLRVRLAVAQFEQLRLVGGSGAEGPFEDVEYDARWRIPPDADVSLHALLSPPDESTVMGVFAYEWDLSDEVTIVRQDLAGLLLRAPAGLYPLTLSAPEVDASTTILLEAAFE